MENLNQNAQKHHFHLQNNLNTKSRGSGVIQTNEKLSNHNQGNLRN